MEYYQKCEDTEESLDYSIPGINTADAYMLIITQTTKPQLIISSALQSLKQNSKLLWIGSGSAADRAILCAKITKKRAKLKNEYTYITYKKVIEFWEPVLEGLDKLQVTRSIPTVLIFQSQNDLDTKNG